MWTYRLNGSSEAPEEKITTAAAAAVECAHRKRRRLPRIDGPDRTSMSTHWKRARQDKHKKKTLWPGYDRECVHRATSANVIALWSAARMRFDRLVSRCFFFILPEQRFSIRVTRKQLTLLIHLFRTPVYSDDSCETFSGSMRTNLKRERRITNSRNSKQIDLFVYKFSCSDILCEKNG